MRRKKKFTGALSLALSLLMSFSCIQPVMAAQAVPDVGSVSKEVAAQERENEDTNVSVSEAPAESTENTQAEETAPAETTESTQEESKAESPVAEGPATLSSDSEISPLADTDAYAILYGNGELVFQRGSTPDAGKGNVVKTYAVVESGKNVPWSKDMQAIKSVSFKDVIKPVSTNRWFYNCKNLTDADLTNLDTSAVTDMDCMFSGCNKLTSLDVSSFNTSAVKNMSSMFCNCNSLTGLDLSSFDTKSVTNMNDMFNGCNSLTGLDVSSFDTKSVTYMMRMFDNCSSLTGLDVSSFDTKSVTYMNSMFYNCSSLTSLDVSSFDTSAVKSMYQMFFNCSSLTNLDLSSFDTSAVTSMNFMFKQCIALDTLTLGTRFAFKGDTCLVDATWYRISTGKEYTTSVLTSTYDGPTMADTYTQHLSAAYAILYGNGELVFQRGNTPDASKGTVLGTYTGFETEKYTGNPSDYAPWYKNRRSVKSVSFKDAIKPVSTAWWFADCVNVTKINFTNLNTSAVTNMTCMFSNCSSLTSLDLSSFNTSAVTDMGSMFIYCGSLTNLDLSSFNTSAVTNMIRMFSNCSSLTSLDLSSFDTSAVTNMGAMFFGCGKLTSLDVSSFDTSAVTDMGWMFINCSSLTSLDLSSFNTSAVTDMTHMFSGCGKLTSLDVSSFDTSAVTAVDSMFSNCNSLTNLDLRSFDTSAAVTTMYSMFKQCTALETLTLGTKFVFEGNTGLVDATWHGINTNKEYTTSVLTSTYDGATMADTYVKLIDITFEAMGGKSSESTKLGYIGMAFDSLPTAEKKDYDFVGWFTQKQGGTQLLVNQPITQSTYYAQYTEHKYTITVTNDVTGTMGDRTKDFTFQLKMTGNTPAEIPYTKGEETGTLAVVDGVAEFTLSHGENIVLSEIPIGTIYKITEVDGASSGYTVESTNSSGTLTKDTNVSFTNTRNGTVPTAAHTNVLISIGLFAIALAGLFWYLRKRKQ